MSNKIFTNFYFSKDLENHSIDEVQREYEEKNGDISKYIGRMFCPECKQAELSFTHKTSNRRAYLSKLPSSNHLDYCSYNYEYASNKLTKEYISSLSDNQINDKLESVLNSILGRKKGDSTIKDMKSLSNNPFLIEDKINYSKSKYKVIPRKSLNTWIDKSEDNKIYLFYGRVKLEVEEINGKGYYNLLIKVRKNKSWKYKIKVFRAKIKDNVDIDIIYDIAIFGHVEFYNGYPQIKTEKLNSIKFRISNI